MGFLEPAAVRFLTKFKHESKNIFINETPGHIGCVCVCVNVLLFILAPMLRGWSTHL